MIQIVVHQFVCSCEGIYQIPMLYPRKLCKFKKMIVCESVEFSGKHSFTLYPSLDPYSDRMTDRETNTLAARGLEELFFQLCCCVSFWFWREIGFGFTYLCMLLNKLFYKHTCYAWAGWTFFPVVLLCQFSVQAGNRFWFYILLMYLEYHTVVVSC